MGSPRLANVGSGRGQIPLGQEVQKLKTKPSVLTKKIQDDFTGKTSQSEGSCSQIPVKISLLRLDA